MSITKQTTTVHAAAAIVYAHYGRPANVDESRAAAWRSDFRNPYDAITSIESMLKGTGRKNEALMIIQSFSSEELDPSNPATPEIVADAAYVLAKEIAPNSPCDVVVHLDSDGGNPHAHITIANVDLVTGKAARENGLAHWVLKRVNDKIMQQMGLEVLEPKELAHDVNRARSGASAQGLSVNQLDKNTWREFLADRVDEALLDPHCIDFDSLQAVASEMGVSIQKKTSAKSEAQGRDPSVTYALVDDHGNVRRFGRSKAACTAKKLGADYGWVSLHKTIKERLLRNKEKEDVQSYGENEHELTVALAELREAEQDREVTPQFNRVTKESKPSNDSFGTRDDHANECVEIRDASALDGLRAQLIKERAERDQADLEQAKRDAARVRRNSQRQADREAARRVNSQRIRVGSLLDDEGDQRESEQDDFEFG